MQISITSSNKQTSLITWFGSFLSSLIILLDPLFPCLGIVDFHHQICPISFHAYGDLLAMSKYGRTSCMVSKSHLKSHSCISMFWKFLTIPKLFTVEIDMLIQFWLLVSRSIQELCLSYHLCKVLSRCRVQGPTGRRGWLSGQVSWPLLEGSWFETTFRAVIKEGPGLHCSISLHTPINQYLTKIDRVFAR